MNFSYLSKIVENTDCIKLLKVEFNSSFIGRAYTRAWFLHCPILRFLRDPVPQVLAGVGGEAILGVAKDQCQKLLLTLLSFQ